MSLPDKIYLTSDVDYKRMQNFAESLISHYDCEISRVRSEIAQYEDDCLKLLDKIKNLQSLEVGYLAIKNNYAEISKRIELEEPLPFT